MTINVTKNMYKLNLEDLMVVANRANNPKRNFLFVSKLLGKHIEVEPNICKIAGRLLTSTLYGRGVNTNLLVDAVKNVDIKKEDLLNELNTSIDVSENAYVLGFAETATGLGMAVAATIKNSFYQTTTREEIVGIENMLSFEEEHSHATSHKCFTLDKDAIMKADRIILVDDEITTGNSMRNLIRELSKITPVKNYTILSVLDWRSEENILKMDKLRDELNLNIEVLSLLAGTVEVEDTSVFTDEEPIEISDKTTVTMVNEIDRITVQTTKGEKNYYKHSGRFGVKHEHIAELENKCRKIAEKINSEISKEDKILVMGHGEDIYIPSRVAAYIDGDVKFKTTTRSPIYCDEREGYPIKTKHSFKDEDVVYYLYNKEQIEREYNKVILLVENNLDIKLTDNITIVKL